MAGIPFHSAEGYLAKLVKLGGRWRSASRSGPGHQQAGGAPGGVDHHPRHAVSDEALLDERRDNLLAAILGDERLFGLAVLDVTSGRFQRPGDKRLGKPCWPNWSASNPAELLIPDDWPQGPAGGEAPRRTPPRAVGLSIATRRKRASAAIRHPGPERLPWLPEPDSCQRRRRLPARLRQGSPAYRPAAPAQPAPRPPR